MKAMRMVFAAVLTTMLFGLGGCATVPQETVILSGELTKMIRSAEASHLALVDEYVAEKKNRADDFLQRVWIPAFTAKGTKNTKILDSLAAERDPQRKAALLQEFNEDVAVEIAKRRGTIMSGIDEIGNSLREAVRDHFTEMLAVNQSLTAHLSSVAGVTKARDELFSALKVNPKSLIPINDINKALEDVLMYKDDAEKIPDIIKKIKDILKGR